MRHLSLAAIAMTAALVLGAGPARAQAVTAKNPASVAAALQGAGYQAEMAKDDGGDPMIKSASSGTKFAIFFYGCTDNADCRSVQFFVGYNDAAKASPAVMNAFNRDNRYSRAYVSDKGAARLEMDLNLTSGGISQALFADDLRLWVTLMSEFEKALSD